MKLKNLLKQLPEITFKGPKGAEITGICSDSRRLVPGNLFIARKGHQFDGSAFIPAALAAGAGAIATDLYDPSLRGVPQLVSHDLVGLEGRVAAAFYHHPCRELFTVGITGTNGKTTTTFILKHLFDQLSLPCGLIGSIEYIIGDTHHRATHTTPDVTTNHKTLRDMVVQGCRAAVMEVSSHALDQRRVDQITFDVGVFTNLSQDHLDYHHSMEAYAEAKAKLFPMSRIAVINNHDEASSRMTKGFQGEILTYGFAEADLLATDLQLSLNQTSFTCRYRGEQAQVKIPLIGRFNVLNCLAAIGVALACGFSLKQLAPRLATLPQVRGRLEQVSTSPTVLVDFAHTPDALEKVLACLQEVSTGRIVTVFGCGGDRDRTKRPRMGEVASRLSDHVIVTSDNPRSEEPLAICQEVVATLTASNWEIEVDRRSAIRKAVQGAKPSDLIVIAGKGHETNQIFAHQTLPFDDRAVAREFLTEMG